MAFWISCKLFSFLKNPCTVMSLYALTTDCSSTEIVLNHDDGACVSHTVDFREW